MKISVRWLNEYLVPGDVTAAEAEHALTFAGFPIESTEQTAEGDVCLDVEVTSNRGDVLCHIGVAREVAVLTGRKLKLPAVDQVFDWSATPAAGGGGAGAGGGVTACAVDNRVVEQCRLFTAQVIRGVKVGPSPKWLVEALAAVGQRSINNVVDVTNFVALEYGQPSHVFDARMVAKNAAGVPELIVRVASKGEKLKLLDGKTIALAGDELVVADAGGEGGAGRAISLAGVMGGADTEVTERTVDVILEAATWEPVAVRRAARRFNIRTDASYRFERVVDPRTIEAAARRAAGLIVRLAGGELSPTMVKAGPSLPANGPIKLRPKRIAQMLGVEPPAARVAEILKKLEISVQPGGDAMTCVAPAFRPDLTREIDLIEEVARVHGLDKLPVHEKVAAAVAPPQNSERGMGELTRVLTGLGFYEAVTFTFVSEKAAKPFVPRELTTIAVCDDRRKADPVLRPSALPSLLACRRANQDAGVTGDGGAAGAGIRLYETSAVFAQTPPASKGTRGKELETRNLALLMDAALPEGGKAFERKQAAVRGVRGAIEALVQALGGSAAAAKLSFEPVNLPMAAYDAAASGVVKLDGQTLGVFGLMADAVQREYSLALPVAAAELGLDRLIGLYPPRALVQALPQFPSIERDLSLIVSETTSWASVRGVVDGARGAGALPLMDEFWFVTSYRGQPVPAGKKSVTFRMRFRDPSDGRTLRHEEVDPQVNGLIGLAKEKLGAEVRV